MATVFRRSLPSSSSPADGTEANGAEANGTGAGPGETVVRLATGTLYLTVRWSDLDPDSLCDFATRDNRKRPFLFVSRVLGRHLPATPQVMDRVHGMLADKLGRAGLPGPVVVVGMAETAVCLGQGVHEHWSGHRDDLLFIHSTRHVLPRPRLLQFEEGHSHATRHFLYRPDGARAAALLADARSLVVIDDEATTGETFAGLVRACRGVMSRLSHAVLVTLTDWTGPERQAALRDGTGLPVGFVSLLGGVWRFSGVDAQAVSLPVSLPPGGRRGPFLPSGNYGRFGLVRPPPLPACLDALRGRAGERILVIGNGEFVFPPFQLARRLSGDGATVCLQAITRSPILEGGPIRGRLVFRDCSGDDTPNFLYGPRPGSYDRRYVCYETPPESAQTELLAQLRAEPLFFA